MKNNLFQFKTFALSILCVLAAFCLCGCAEVNFVTYHNNDGSIVEYVYLAIDEQKLINNGYNIDAVHLEIKTNSHNETQSLISDYRNKLYEQHKENLITNNEYTSLYNGIKMVEQDWNNGEYIIGLQFQDSATYKHYYQTVNNVELNSNVKQVKKLFYTKTYYYGTTNFGDYSIFNRIYNYYTNTAFSTISPQETTLSYSYSVSSRRFHSDADQIQLDDNGNYIHTWIVDPSVPAQEIYFYTTSANRSIWIIASIIISLAVTTILCLVGLIILKINKRKNIENQEYELDDNIE